MKKLLIPCLAFLTFIFSANSLTAQEVESVQIGPNNPIPTSPHVIKGTLQNGLTYYIRENEKPEDILELRLVVNAGSILEDSDQRGLAHFMEHMNFNGTTHFKKNQLVDYLQSIGVQFGADLNAYTGFGRTVYILPIPTDNPEELNKGFLVLEDWAHGALLKPDMIEGERGVILEEYRTGLGAGKRMRQEYLPVILKGSRYAKRLPIGTKENIKNFEHASLQRFYEDWYRPELMAVIAVGDLDPQKTLQKIKEHFGDIATQKNPRERKVYSIPNHEETYVAVATDEEAALSRVQVIYQDKGTRQAARSVGDFRDQLVERLFSQMINNRLNELRNSPNPPFIFGSSYHGRYWSRQKQAYRSTAVTSKTGQLRALKALLVTNKKVKQFGFEPVELERAKKEMLSSFKDSYKGRKTRSSSSYIGGYMSNYLSGSPIPGIVWKYKTAQKLIPQIKLSEVSHLIDKYLHKNNRTVLLTGPALQKKNQVTKAEVKKVLASVASMEVTPYEVDEVRDNLMLHPPVGGTIIERSKNEALGTTTLTLSNGAEVIYKKTDFKDNQILFRAFSYGGTSLYSNEVYLETAFANGGLTEAGIAGLSKTDLNHILSGKNVSVSPYISGLTEGLRGNSTPEDLETMFKLVNLYFTDLNKDKEAFQSFISRQKALFANFLKRPRFYFINELNKFIYGNNPRYIGFPTPEMFEKANYDLAYKKYKQRFANAGDFKFYFVGDIPVEKLEQYAEKYLAGLPATSEKEEYRTFPYRPLSGMHKKIVRKGIAPKSFVQIIYQGETEYSPEADYYLRSLGDILTIKLIENLREKESGVYGAGASGGLGKIPYGSYSFRIAFPCGPENVEKLIDAALAEVQKIIKNGPTAEDLKKIKETQLLSYKENMKQNRFWMRNLVSAATSQTDKTAFLEFKSKVEALTAEDIQRAAKKYLTQGHITGILYPEKEATAGK